MKALKITHNSEQYIVATPTESGIVTFIISSENSENPRLDVGGYDPETETHFDWIKTHLKPNSVVNIEVLESINRQKLSEPFQVRQIESTDLVNREKLKYFHRLKKELEEKGLL